MGAEPNEASRALDEVAVEEPLAVMLSYWRKGLQLTENFAVVMRTPGADQELATGLLLTEGVITSCADIAALRTIGIEPSNEVLVELTPQVDFEAFHHRRAGIMSSSCGVCGKAVLDAFPAACYNPTLPLTRITPDFLLSLPSLLLARQPTFGGTGGAHAAALVSLQGNLEFVFEDVGRHNALDKLIGRAAACLSLPLSNHLVFLSSRASYELIQKTAIAGIQIFACVGAPSSLAIETARHFGLTLVCFLRNERFNVYSGDARLALYKSDARLDL